MSKINIRDRNKNKPDKKPNWEYRFEGAKVDGKRKHISKSGFRTKKEALEAGTKALAEYNQAGLHFEPSEVSVHDYLEYWFENHCRINLKYNTQENYLRIIKNHLQPKFGHYKLKSLTPSVIQEYANGLKLNGYSKSHVIGIISTFSAALDYAVEPLHYIQQNPLRYVKMPKIEKKPKERIVLTLENWNTIIDRFKDTRFYIPLMVGFYCGLRISETFALTWEDINLDTNTLTVNKQTVKRNFGSDVRKVVEQKGKREMKSSWYFQTPKTEKSNRTVKFGNALAEALRKEKIRQAENELKYGEYYTIHVIKNETDEKGNPIKRIIPAQKLLEPSLPRVKMLCVAENGEYTSTDSFKYCSKTINYSLKITFDYHSLRHTHATKLIEAGVSPKAVQERLGHEKIETTLQTYVHNTESMEQSAVDVFEKVVDLSTS